MDKVGLAIVGSTGAIGNTHIEGINNISSGKLVGIYARRQEPLMEQAVDLGVRAYPNLEELLSATEIDAIIIATPHPSHLDITLKAVQAGKHVLVEKPISVTPS